MIDKIQEIRRVAEERGVMRLDRGIRLCKALDITIRHLDIDRQIFAEEGFEEEEKALTKTLDIIKLILEGKNG
jgi:hypothetical protein